jgi:hypothetical protein
LLPEKPLKTRTLLSSLALTTLALGNAGCPGPKASGDVQTSDFYANYRVTGRGDTAEAEADLRVNGPGGTDVNVAGGDSLWCDAVQLLAPPPTSIELVYSAKVPQGQAEYVFDLRRSGRAGGKQIVPGPVAFKITSDALDGTYASDFTLTWAPANVGGKVSVWRYPISQGAPAECIGGPSLEDLTGEDTGTIVIDGARFRPKDGSVIDCTYKLELHRVQSSPVGAPFAGGELRSTHIEATTLHIHR